MLISCFFLSITSFFTILPLDIAGKWEGSAEFSIKSSDLKVDEDFNIDFTVIFHSDGKFEIVPHRFVDRLFVIAAKSKYKLSYSSYKMVERKGDYYLQLSIEGPEEMRTVEHQIEIISESKIILHISEDDGGVYKLPLQRKG